MSFYTGENFLSPVTYLPAPRIRNIRENLQSVLVDLAWLATRPDASQEFVLAGMRVENALKHFEAAVKEEEK